jgi:hypothetical protein
LATLISSRRIPSPLDADAGWRAAVYLGSDGDPVVSKPPPAK